MKKLFLLTLIFIPLAAFCAGEKPSPGVEIIYFYSSHCKVCAKLSRDFLPAIEEKYKDVISLQKLNTGEGKNLAALLAAVDKFGEERGVIPSVVIGNEFLTGKNEIVDKLEFLIQHYGGLQVSSRFVLAGKDIIETFKGFSLPTILAAGLIDGINPCAFAVVVFFISFLSVYGYSKKEIAVIGICYVFSVYLTYILLGLGLLKIFHSLRHFYLIQYVFYYLVASLCFVLAGLAVYDYVKYKKTGKGEALVLQLPEFLKKQVNVAIGSGLRDRHNARTFELCFISLGVGFMVSLLEAACTGQVYLPTVMYIMKLPELRFKAFFYLVFYNLMFILPLLCVFILSFLGVRSRQFNLFLKRRLGSIKLSLAGLFLVLGLAILMITVT